MPFDEAHAQRVDFFGYHGGRTRKLSTGAAEHNAPALFQPVRAGAWLNRARVPDGEPGRARTDRIAQSARAETDVVPSARQEHHLSVHGGRPEPARAFRL